MKKQLFKLLVTIVDRAKGERIAAICREQGVLFQMVCLGHGTASSEVLDLLGLGRTEKAVVLSLVPGGDVSGIFHAFADKMQILGPGSGIAFSLPLSSIGAALSAVGAKTDEVETKGENPVMDSAVQKDLVLAVVEPGHTDEAMEAARQVGARGGTVLHARDMGSEEAARFFGISIRPEREILAVVVTREMRQAVMQAISRAAGSQTPAKGLILSIPVDEAIGMR